MDWRRATDDPGGGLSGLLERAQQEVGGTPLRGTRFLHDASDMLRATREIEAAVTDCDTTLWVGFQSGEKLAGEVDVYRELCGRGTRVHGFGEGSPAVADELDGFTWTSVASSPGALENQWFLITREPEPVAFVGYETSPEEQRTEGSAGDAPKSWEGFVTSDARLIDLLIDHLDGVRAGRG